MKIFYVNVLRGWCEEFYLIKICVSSHTLTLAQRLSLTNLCAYFQGISYMFREYPMCSGSTLCVQGVPYVFREYPMCSGSTLCVQGVPYVLDEHTEVLPILGHTGSDISVVVRNTPIGTVVVAGMGRGSTRVERQTLN